MYTSVPGKLGALLQVSCTDSSVNTRPGGPLILIKLGAAKNKAKLVFVI